MDSQRCRHSPRSCGWLHGVSFRATSSAAAVLGLESGEAEGRACAERRGMGEAAPSPQPLYGSSMAMATGAMPDYEHMDERKFRQQLQARNKKAAKNEKRSGELV